MNTDKHRYKKVGKTRLRPRDILSLSVFICVHLWIILFSSCSSKPSDLRTLVPAETLVYLETNDLAAALQPIVDSKPFREVAKSKPDFSALKGVQVAVAVTGFETSEVEVSDEQSVGKVQPRFVAVADTHAWNYQAVAFAEKKLGSFVTEIFDAEPKLEKSDKNGGKYFTWTSQNAGDGRKAFALVIDSLIYFGNDESAIDKALAVRRGELDSIAKTGKLQPHVPGNLAGGYVSPDGVAQIAALAGIHFASQASDEEEVQSALAGILPQLIRGTVTDVSWSTSQTSEGIEDKWLVTMPAEIANVFVETMTVGDRPSQKLLANVAEDADQISVYSFKDSRVAWRSVLLTSQKLTDPFVGKIINEFSSALFAPYGIRDAEQFLSSVKPPIVVGSFEDDDTSFAVAEMTNAQTTRSSLSTKTSQSFGQLSNEDEDVASLFGDNIVITGSSKRLKDLDTTAPFSDTRLLTANAPIVSKGRDRVSALRVVDLLARKGQGDTQVVSTYLTETRFTKTGMERRTVSDLGFIGWLIAQIAAE